MARVRLITDRDEDLSPEQIDTFDWVVESRGSHDPALRGALHSPAGGQARCRTRSQDPVRLVPPDHDRELVILATAHVHGCAFEWDSHLPLARAAGVREEVIDHLRQGGEALTESESVFIGFVRELCADSTVSSETFDRAIALLGESGVVELSATVGYYTMLAMVMGACDAC